MISFFSFGRNKRAFLVFAFLFTSFSLLQSQELIKFSFNNNLNPDLNPQNNPNDILEYRGSNFQSKNPNYYNNKLEVVDFGDYLELRLDTQGLSEMVMSFDAELSFYIIGVASWDVFGTTSNNIPWSNFNALGEYPILGFSFGNGTRSRSFSLPIPAIYNNQPMVRFRIRSRDIFSGTPKLRIDNLKISTSIPHIEVFTNSDLLIPHNSAADPSFNTDFGDAIVVDEDRTSPDFRIRNVKNDISKLKIDHIEISGPNPEDFEIVGNLNGQIINSNISPTSGSSFYKSFKVRFVPKSDGLRKANVNIYTNGDQSPYSFEVIGQGASCALMSTPYVINTFDPTILEPTLPSNGQPSDWITGTAQDNDQVRLYPNGAISIGPDETSWFSNSTKEIEFGGVNGIDLSGQKDVSIVFNLGAYSNSSYFNSGPNKNSRIILSVYNFSTNTYSSEIEIRGSNNNNTSFKYLIEETNIPNSNALSTYSGNNSPQIFTNSVSNKYKRIRLKIPASKLATNPNIKFKIRMATGSTSRYWIIDNPRIEVSNSVFTEFTNGAWTNGNPNAKKKAVIKDGTYNLTSDAEVCECEVKSAATLNVGTTSTTGNLTVRGQIVVEENGVFTVSHNSNLIQLEDDVLNQGKIKLTKNFILTSARDQYNFVISPAIGQNLKGIFSVPSTVIRYNEANSYFYNSNGDYLAGRGLGVKEPPTGNGIALFQGVPFNGFLSYPLQYTPSTGDLYGFNLSGNPYPSNIDVKILYERNSDIIQPEFYFWDNRGNTETQQQGSDYVNQSYAIYNAASDLGNPAPGSVLLMDVRKPTKYVQVGTGFMVQAKSTINSDSLKFRNSIRTKSAGPSYFGKFTGEETPNRFWLKMQTPSEISIYNALVYYPEGNNELGLEDSKSLGGSDDFYFLLDSAQLVIQGKEDFQSEDIVPLGFKAFQSGMYSIQIDEKQGVFEENVDILLIDKTLGLTFNLSHDGEYFFETELGEFNERFEIRYASKERNDESLELIAENLVEVIQFNDEIIITSSLEKIVDISFYVLNGNSVFEKTNINSLEFKVPSSYFKKEILILNIKTESGEIYSKKIINKNK